MAIVTATGHRPNKAGGYSQEARARLVRIAMQGLMEAQANEAIVGMALGWDTAVAIACHTLNIPFTAAIPFLGQEKLWPESSQELYHFLLRSPVLKEVVYVSEEGYAPWKMQVRNEWMVDRCNTVLAMWDGSSGGTGNCIAYAQKKEKPITNLWDLYNKKEQDDRNTLEHSGLPCSQAHIC